MDGLPFDVCCTSSSSKVINVSHGKMHTLYSLMQVLNDFENWSILCDATSKIQIGFYLINVKLFYSNWPEIKEMQALAKQIQTGL